MRLAITLLTCNREALTQQTLETLLTHNPDLSRCLLLHGDDASASATNLRLAERAGFETVYPTRKRRGVAHMTEQLFRIANERGVDAILNLQNDWVSERAIPFAEIAQVLADPRFYTVRLYGQFKSRHGRAGIHHGGRTPRAVVWWQPLREGWEMGDIHWGHPPAVTRTAWAVNLTRGAASESESRLRSGYLKAFTARPVVNVVRHVGAERTPGFKA